MSIDDKKKYMDEVLNGNTVSAIATRIGRRPEVLSKMLRLASIKLGVGKQWTTLMKQRRRESAIKNLPNKS